MSQVCVRASMRVCACDCVVRFVLIFCDCVHDYVCFLVLRKSSAQFALSSRFSSLVYCSGTLRLSVVPNFIDHEV